MAEKKKILFVVEAMGGGVFTYITDLANELVKEYQMYVAYAIREQTPENFREYFDQRVHLIEVKNFTRSIDFRKDIKAFFEIKNIAKRIQPDIIHLHSSKAGTLGRLAFRGKKVPVFYTPHGYSFLMQNQSAGKRMFYWVVEKLCSKGNCWTISCSKGEHEETLKLTKNADYVNNGINIQDLQNLIDRAGPSPEHPFTVFTIGRICYQKNPFLFNKIAEAMPEIKFLWVGDGELRNELTASNIEITGWARREDALKYSLCGDVFLLTSLWEGLPISLLEAMYMKKTCVVSNVIGNRDVIHTGVNGFVCDDVNDYKQAIEMAKEDAIGDMAEAASREILNSYNTKTMAEQYSSIYFSKQAGQILFRGRS